MCHVTTYDNALEGHVEVVHINMDRFPAGSVLIVRTHMTEGAAQSLSALAPGILVYTFATKCHITCFFVFCRENGHAKQGRFWAESD